MKKHLLIGAALLAAISVYPQQNLKKASGMVNTKHIAHYKFADYQPQTPAQPAAPLALIENYGPKTAVTNTWQKLTASMNIYGVVIPYTKPLQYNDELNAVSFIHRKSPTYQISPAPASTAETGGIVAMISVDCGTTWDSTAIYSNDTYWGRYPSGGIYNASPTNTDITQAFIVGAGPATWASGGWPANWYASKRLGSASYDNMPSTVPNAQQIAVTTGPFLPNVGRHDFAAYGFTATDDGVIRLLAGVNDDNTAQDSSVMVITGTFNTVSETFDWSGYVIDPPVTKASDGSANMVGRYLMAFNEAGTIGYIVILGSREGATFSNVGLQPIVYKTVNSGVNWTLENAIDFNLPAYDEILRPIVTVSADTFEVPMFNYIESLDATVDANGKLHIFTPILGHFSNHPDSLFYTALLTTNNYRYPHTAGRRLYLYDFVFSGSGASGTWTYNVVDTAYTEGPNDQSSGHGGYNDNPWDMDPSNNNQKVRLDDRVQMSRTPDGQYIVYTWADSDTNVTTSQLHWNTFPNIKAKLYSVAGNSMHPNVINVTNQAGVPGDVNSRAFFHITSPKCRVTSTNNAVPPVIRVPFTVSNSNPLTQLSKNDHWFSFNYLNFGNIPDTDILQPCFLPDKINEISIGVNSSYIYPNPAARNAMLTLTMPVAAKLQVNVLNTIGQVVKTSEHSATPGQNNFTLDLNGLSTGVYLVKVSSGPSSATKKLIVE